MGLKAILRGGIAGEVFDGQNNRAFVQAVVAILIALDQSLGNIAGDIGTLAVSTGGTGPAGVRGHIDLRAVHDVQALGLHHLAVGLGHLIDHVGVAVANDSRADAQRVRVTDVDGVGVERIRNGHAALAGLVFQHLGLKRCGTGPPCRPRSACHRGKHRRRCAFPERGCHQC